MKKFLILFSSLLGFTRLFCGGVSASEISGSQDSCLITVYNAISNSIFEHLNKVHITIDGAHSLGLLSKNKITNKGLLSNYQSSKILEMGMNMIVDQKFSCKAGVFLSKNQHLYKTESKSKSLTSLRIKPDLYTFQIILKFKI